MSSRLTSPEPSPLPLPFGIKSRQINLSHRGHLSYHILEAGSPSLPLLVLLHGFPEISYSWRKTILPLANAGYHVIAPDQRGFGRTTGWDTRSYKDVDLHTFSATVLVQDILVLVAALGYTQVNCVVGHDAGAVVAANCALMRPDIFQAVVLMTHPFAGIPELPFGAANGAEETRRVEEMPAATAAMVHDQLASLGRKHYEWYYSTARANADMVGPVTPGGLRGFFRGYFHVKSGSWNSNYNTLHPPRRWSAEELAEMPEYYIMPLQKTMPETIHEMMLRELAEAKESSKQWLSNDELEVYVSEYARTSFQGGLNWYRVWTGDCGSRTSLMQDLYVFSGLKIKVPCCFIGGQKDWGMYQVPGALERMCGSKEVCEDFRFCKIIDGAGHWIAQEKPNKAVEGILEFLRGVN
ncbi:putative epoxide hydrolase [Talaromyces proteolyticus]|uniref:Epoxide hydrolase n=1 Tax=Talaromyces proteolyticus TaxID=1131652 RepID=A0AAD4PYP3_9EURO|nr:putative epoxide hydrolase [Talaromyces proteolyticus]KAH8701735.1 putative epoxide hydrolase [Talaromyces proteolyticus]